MNYTSNEEFFRSVSPTTDPGLDMPLESYRDFIRNAPLERDVNLSRPIAPSRIHLWRTTPGRFHVSSPDEIISGLSDPLWERRMEAIRTLETKEKQIGDEEILALQSIAKDDPEEKLRAAAVEALGRLEMQAPIAAFLVALTDPSWEVRTTAAQALGKQGERVPRECLIRTLEEEGDESVREAVVRALGKRKKHMPVDLLRTILRKDESWLVREAAAWALGQLGENVPLQQLSYALRCDENERVRMTAAQSLGQSLRREAERPLLEALHDKDEEVQRMAAWALQQLDEQTRGMHHWGRTQHFDSSLTPFEEALTFSKEREKLSQEKKEKKQAKISSPVWGESWEDLALQALQELTQFISDKRGFLHQSTLLNAVEGERTLLLSCFYEQAGSFLQKKVLQPVEKVTEVESLEAALQSQDEGIQIAIRQAFEAWEERQWQDLLIVSFAFFHPLEEEKRECKPLRVIVSGMGCERVRKDDPSVLHQMTTAWENTVEDSLICQHPQDLANLKVWYQPILGEALPQYAVG